MREEALIKLLGLLGFVLYVIITVITLYYIVLPSAMPTLVKQLENTLSSEGITMSQSELMSTINFTMTITIIAMPVGAFIDWLISSAILMGLLRAFKQVIGYIDTWLISGNYFYVNTLNTAITTLTPLINYEINTIALHKNALTYPPILGINIAFAVIGSLLLAYILNKTHQLNFTKSFIATIIAQLIFIALSILL